MGVRCVRRDIGRGGVIGAIPKGVCLRNYWKEVTVAEMVGGRCFRFWVDEG